MFFVPNLHLVATIKFIKRIALIKNFEVVISNKKIGTTFCHVKKKKAVNPSSLGISEAPQKCRGANLDFSNILIGTHLDIRVLVSDKTPPHRIPCDPIL